MTNQYSPNQPGLYAPSGMVGSLFCAIKYQVGVALLYDVRLACC
jgi:hypothetical protein